MAKKKQKAPPTGPTLDSLPDDPVYPFVVWVDPKSLDGNPDNWRIHDRRQRSAYNALRGAVGKKWIDCPKYNVVTKRLYDGHMRVEEAIKEKLQTIPVMVQSLTESEEAAALLSMDTLGTMASSNTAALRDLTAKVKGTVQQVSKTHKDALDRLSRDLNKKLDNIDKGREKPQGLPATRDRKVPEEETSNEEDEPSAITYTIEDDVIYRSSNPWGLPDLKDCFLEEPPDSIWDRGPDFNHTETTMYCQSSRPFPPERQGGILAFYTEDYRFNRCYDDAVRFASQLIDEDWTGVFMPDYSQYSNWPFAINLFNLYKSRWCGRYWQDFDIPVVPLLHTMGGFEKYKEIALETLPKSIPMVAIEARTYTARDKKGWNEFDTCLDAALKGLKMKHVLIYGGDEHKNRVQSKPPRGVKFHYLPSYTAERRRRMKGEK